ncbi:22992_t:CDS:2 [Gigaspora margarita]|uniref:tRNA (guanine-N(7)-)-methyltransferase n=1 Tax=Gigaspora margarita TaxID=4874 RepID=A0ABN7UI46_GIGMA|nr:22992_t:CDS:2 [Gigaspora margarita]
MDWSTHYPAFVSEENSSELSLNAPIKQVDRPLMKKKVEFADLGCGYGGLLFSLSTLYPETLMLGMEIRVKVEEYVREKIIALRLQHPGQYQNISIIRMNVMKFLPNFFEKGQILPTIELVIYDGQTTTEYAYVLRVGGIIYTISDVKDLHEWMVKHLDEHPLFERIPDEEVEKDPVIPFVRTDTEEGKKVERNKGEKFLACYRRIMNQ